MPAVRSPQLELALVNPVRGGVSGGIIVTRVLKSHRSCKRTLEKVHYVLRYFPELGGAKIKVGLTKAASGMAVPGGFEIWLNPHRVSYHTISHELVHLLQRTAIGVPQGERSCDVYSLARHWTLNDVVPSYVEIPSKLASLGGTLPATSARLVYETAVEALEHRHDGMRRYISWFEERLRAAVSRRPSPDAVIPSAFR